MEHIIDIIRWSKIIEDHLIRLLNKIYGILYIDSVYDSGGRSQTVMSYGVILESYSISFIYFQLCIYCFLLYVSEINH